MKQLCNRCNKNTESKNVMNCTTYEGQEAILSHCVDCGCRRVKLLMKGSGIIDSVKTVLSRIRGFITGRKPGSPELMEFIEKFGDEVIREMYVCREPIDSAIQNILNIISLGAFNKITRSNAAYDNLFHLFLVFKTDSGSYRTERNEIVRVYSGGTAGETLGVDLHGRDIKIGEFFENAIQRQGDNIFVYDAFKSNCQDYILTLLVSNSIITRRLMAFIKQDLTDLVNQLPNYMPSFAKYITDFAARLRILQGKGRKHNKKIRTKSI